MSHDADEPATTTDAKDPREKSLLSPTIDIVFKMMLAHPDSTPLLVDLANTILMPKDPFETMTVLNPEIPKEDIDHKGITLDILATTARGDKIQVEM